MGLISVSPINNGDNGDATVVSNNFSVLANEFNGNIDNNNIKGAAAIDAAKLLDNSISVGKIKAGCISLGSVSNVSSQTLGTSIADVSSLISSVNVPVGGRSVRMTFAGAIQQNSDGLSFVSFYFLKDGVNQRAKTVHVTAGGVGLAYTIIHEDASPTSGGHTYKLQAQYANGASAPYILGGSSLYIDLV